MFIGIICYPDLYLPFSTFHRNRGYIKAIFVNTADEMRHGLLMRLNCTIVPYFWNCRLYQPLCVARRKDRCNACLSHDDSCHSDCSSYLWRHCDIRKFWCCRSVRRQLGCIHFPTQFAASMLRCSLQPIILIQNQRTFI